MQSTRNWATQLGEKRGNISPRFQYNVGKCSLQFQSENDYSLLAQSTSKLFVTFRRTDSVHVFSPSDFTHSPNAITHYATCSKQTWQQHRLASSIRSCSSTLHRHTSHLLQCQYQIISPPPLRRQNISHTYHKTLIFSAALFLRQSHTTLRNHTTLSQGFVVMRGLRDSCEKSEKRNKGEKREKARETHQCFYPHPHHSHIWDLPALHTTENHRSLPIRNSGRRGAVHLGRERDDPQVERLGLPVGVGCFTRRDGCCCY